MDEIVDRSGVAKATLYRHFPSKNQLVLAFLAEREQAWMLDRVEAEARRLMKGSIVQAAEGDVSAAVRAQAMARLLIEQYR